MFSDVRKCAKSQDQLCAPGVENRKIISVATRDYDLAAEFLLHPTAPAF
jgi:hypothetical protein